MNVFVLAILIYLLYRFTAGFLIPLFRTTRQVREQFKNMNGQANRDAGNPGNTTTETKASEPTRSASSKVGEYIDFEEVKC